MADIMTLKKLATIHLPFHDEQTLQSVSLVPAGARRTRDMAGTGIYSYLADETGSLDEVRCDSLPFIVGIIHKTKKKSSHAICSFITKFCFPYWHLTGRTVLRGD